MSVAEQAPHASAGSPLAPEVTLPTEQTLLTLSASHGAWTSIIDPARGLVVIDFHEDPSEQDPRANADGIIEQAQHLCGARLAEETGRMFTDLHMRVEGRKPEHGPVFTCKGMSCAHEAEMEFDHQGEFVFAAGPKGPRLDHVVRLEGGSATEAFREIGERYAHTQLARLADARCE